MKERRSRKKGLIVLPALFMGLFGMSALPVAAGDPTVGKEKAAVCVACHGETGNSPNGQFPKLAGQHEDYLTNSLLQYKNRERQNAIMVGLVASLSAKDIEDLAAYFANQPGDLVTLELE